MNLLDLDLAAYKKMFSEESPLTSNGESTIPSIKLKHSAIPEYICRRIKKVDFKKEAIGVKMTLTKKQVISIEKMIETVDKSGLGICSHNGSVYMYNGEYWKRMHNAVFERFLSKSAELMGVNRLVARHFTFTEPLVKQFSKVARRPEIDLKEEDQDKVLINLNNGTFEIDGMKMCLRRPDKRDFLTYQLPFPYDEDAVCPIFNEYLDTVLPDAAMQKILAEYLGYLFVKNSKLKLEKALILYGSGANGKSVMFEIVNALLGGRANVSNFSLQNLTNESGYYRAMLAGKLVNYSSEINRKLDESIFKQLVSGEPVDARVPYGEPFTLTNYGKLIFNCNELPRTSDHSKAFFRRFLIIPFDVTIPEAKQDKQLAQKIIQSELPGVLNWVLVGLRRLLTQKSFTQSDEVEYVLKSYIKETDSAALFIDEMGYRESVTNFVQLTELYAEYKHFCFDRGNLPLNYRRFGNRLRNMGINLARKNYGMVVKVTKNMGKSVGKV